MPNQVKQQSNMTIAGVATVRWPGDRLAEVMSARWAKLRLEQLLAAPGQAETPYDLAGQARAAVQQFFMTEKLTPPLLIETLTALMPALSVNSDKLIPHLPWRLAAAQQQVEKTAQQWQKKCLAAGNALNETLAGLKRSWISNGEAWLAQQVANTETGAVLAAHSYLAAVSELLRAFIEGIEHNLHEAEADLAVLEQRLSETAQTLEAATTRLPASPVAALLRCGMRPNHWRRCRTHYAQAQQMARRFARLAQARLQLWQTIWLYEELLPFYRLLLSRWKRVAKRWEWSCKQVVKASRTPNLVNTEQALAAALTAAPGPWNEALVTRLYDDVVNHLSDNGQPPGGTLTGWVAGELPAADIIRQLQTEANRVFAPGFAIPVDRAIERLWPEEESRRSFLAGLARQACSIFSENANELPASLPIETWLFLPGGEASPLAGLAQSWPQPPHILVSPRPDILAVVVAARY
jgi:hypothetical protein